MKCTDCNVINEYAVANRPDGSFRCYGCRLDRELRMPPPTGPSGPVAAAADEKNPDASDAETPKTTVNGSFNGILPGVTGGFWFLPDIQYDFT